MFACYSVAVDDGFPSISPRQYECLFKKISKMSKNLKKVKSFDFLTYFEFLKKIKFDFSF
jgi:hypothetical protein